MSLQAPAPGWYSKKIAADEKIWIVLATVVCLVTFFWMIIWHMYGKQNPSNTTYTTTPAEFSKLTAAFNEQNKIGEEQGIPVVKADASGNVFLSAQMWRWSSTPVLKKDEWYTFHLSSLDVCHGFSVLPINMNFMILPGYDHVLKFKPTEAGEFKIVCNEYCGIGHHLMIGKIVVVENEADFQKYGTASN